VYGPDNPIMNIQNYLSCFYDNGSSRYQLSVYIDQPVHGSTMAINPIAVFTDKHTVGHAYITLTQIISDGNNSSYTIQRIIGFYPLTGGSLSQPTVPGVLGNDQGYTGGWDVKLDIPISGAEMMNIVNFTNGYSSNQYDLRYRNCGNYTTDVLGVIGIQVSPAWMSSYWYTASDGVNSWEVRGPSVGALGEQLYAHPPQRAKKVSNSGGEAPQNLGRCN
jgi:hypothetical protein